MFCKNGLHIQSQVTGRCMKCMIVCDKNGYELCSPTGFGKQNSEASNTGTIYSCHLCYDSFAFEEELHTHLKKLHGYIAIYKNLGEKPNTRKEILDDAAQAVLSDRNTDYGNPEDNFTNICDLWNTRLAIRLRTLGLVLVSYCDALNNNLTPAPTNIHRPHDVAIYMSDVKDSRIEVSPKKKDHWVDRAGYSACGGDCAINK